MKNYAETKSGLGLSSLNEHRLSVGLLILFLIAGASYGLWRLVLPLLPNTVEVTESRTQLATAHIEKKEWEEAADIYRAMIEDDSDNGHAIRQLARIEEGILRKTWKKYANHSATSGNANAAAEILEEEIERFAVATGYWTRLLENARYRRDAYEQLARLHSLRAKYRSDPKEGDKAVKLLEAMIERGLATTHSIRQTRDFDSIRGHDSYNRLVREESRNHSYGGMNPFMNRVPQLGF